MKFRKIFVITAETVLISLLFSSGLFAQSGIEPFEVERVGLSGWQFLKINTDARQVAMGGAFTTTSHGDVGAIFGNPSALVDIKNVSLTFNRVNWIADIGYNTVAVAKNFNGIGVLAVSIASIDMGDIPRTINSPIAGEGRTEAVVTGGSFTGGDIAAGVSYAKRMTDRLSIGGNIRWIREEIDDLSMNNISLDFGTTYYTGFKSLRLAMVARNFGPDQTLVGWSEDVQIEPVDIRMPIDYRVGLAMDFLDGTDSPHLLTVSVEGIHPNDGPERANFGAEYRFSEILALRGGYRFNYDEEAFTFGGGLKFDVSGFSGNVNYAFADFGRLEQVHVFSLGFSF